MSSASNSPASLTQTSNYFGRAWDITLIPINPDGNLSTTKISLGSTGSGLQNLRMTFETEISYIQSAYSYCDLEVWNPSTELQSILLSAGSQLTVCAGYAATFTPDKSRIFQGQVFQPTFERRDVIDYVVKLHCLVARNLGVLNIINTSIPKLQSQINVARQMAALTQNSINIAYVDEVFTDYEGNLPREQVLHGRPDKYYNRLAKNAGCASYFDASGINIRSLTSDPNAVPIATYGPPLQPMESAPSDNYSGTLISVPQQTQQGVSFTVLLDARLVIGAVVALANSTIKLITLQPDPNNAQVIKPLSTGDLRFIVVAVRHHGDTYSANPPWQTQVDCVSLNFWPSFVAIHPDPAI